MINTIQAWAIGIMSFTGGFGFATLIYILLLKEKARER